jgi:hypothetical protein
MRQDRPDDSENWDRHPPGIEKTMGATFATSAGLEPTHQSEFAPESQNSFYTDHRPAGGWSTH